MISLIAIKNIRCGKTEKTKTSAVKIRWFLKLT